MSLTSHILASTLVALGLSACGGSPGETPTTQGGSAQATTTTTSGTGGTRQVDVSEATITVGEEIYQFKDTGSPRNSCAPSLFGSGYFNVALTWVDVAGVPTVPDGYVGVHLVLIREGTGLPGEVPVIAVGADTLGGAVWVADSRKADGSGVESFSIDGRHTHGTANFVSADGGGPVSGTFEVTCAGG